MPIKVWLNIFSNILPIQSTSLKFCHKLSMWNRFIFMFFSKCRCEESQSEIDCLFKFCQDWMKYIMLFVVLTIYLFCHNLPLELSYFDPLFSNAFLLSTHDYFWINELVLCVCSYSVKGYYFCGIWDILIPIYAKSWTIHSSLIWTLYIIRTK